MARIRSMKPEFRSSIVVTSWKREIRLAFSLLWGYLDDFGRGVDSPQLIASDCFPMDKDVTEKKMDGWLNIMATPIADHGEAPLCRYTVGGRRYIHCLNWKEHQRPSHPTPTKIPPCPVHHRTEKFASSSGGIPEAPPEDFASPRETLVPEQGAGSRSREMEQGAGIPPSAALARPGEPPGDLGVVVAAYVDGAKTAGLPRPSERLRGKVGQAARRLADTDGVPLPALITAARSLGAGGWDDLDRELQRLAANNGKPGGASGKVDGWLALAGDEPGGPS